MLKICIINVPISSCYRFETGLQLSYAHMLCRLDNLESMEDGLDESIEWPAMPATAVLLLAGLDMQAR